MRYIVTKWHKGERGGLPKCQVTFFPKKFTLFLKVLGHYFWKNLDATHGGGGGYRIMSKNYTGGKGVKNQSKKCHVLFEWRAPYDKPVRWQILAWVQRKSLLCKKKFFGGFFNTNGIISFLFRRPLGTMDSVCSLEKSMELDKKTKKTDFLSKETSRHFKPFRWWRPATAWEKEYKWIQDEMKRVIMFVGISKAKLCWFLP